MDKENKPLSNVQRRQKVEKCVPRKDVENDLKRTICTWDVGIFSPRKKQSEEFSRAG